MIPQFMRNNRRLPRLPFIFFSGLLLFSCAGVPVQPVEDVDDSVFLSRPRFDGYEQRPLGRVRLDWSVVDGALGYEIQMAYADDFRIVQGAWTVRGTNLEIPADYTRNRWFRIRGFNDRNISQWSPLLLIAKEQ